MEENGGTKSKRIILWVFTIIFLILTTGIVLKEFSPSFDDNAGNANNIETAQPNRPTQKYLRPWSTPDISIGDGGLITQDPCSPPCFWNITPGITTVSEVYQVIEERKIAEWCVPRRKEWNYDAIICWYLFLVNFPEKGDTVSSITLTISQELKIEDIIHELGPPDRVYAEIGEIPDAPDFLNIWILYDDILTEIRLQTQDIRESKGYYQLSETTMVDSITYYENEGYKNSYFYKHASAWEGYGDYEGQWYTYP